MSALNYNSATENTLISTTDSVEEMMDKLPENLPEPKHPQRKSTASVKLATQRDSVILYLTKTARKSLQKVMTGLKIQPPSSVKRVILPLRTSKLILHTDSVDFYNDKSYISRSRTSDSPDPGNLRQSIVSFSPELPNVDDSEAEIIDNTKKRSQKMKKQKAKSKIERKRKPKVQCPKDGLRGIINDPRNMGYIENPDQFTDERIASLVNILKQDKELRKLFTSCIK